MPSFTSSPATNDGGDRFDNVKQGTRVGAHRAVPHARNRGVWVLIATLATLILTATGILLFTLIPGSVSFMDQLTDRGDGQGIQIPGVVEAKIDPETVVVVLNGTSNDDLAFLVDDAINENGWGTTLFAGNADDREVEISAVLYDAAEDEAYAKGLGEKLGGISYYQNPNYATYGNQLTVLLGNDYRGPGSEILETSGE